MRKTLVIAIPILTLILFIFIMQSGSFLKKTKINGEDIPTIINAIIENIDKNEWDKAQSKSDELSNAWKKIVMRIQFSSERDEINFLSADIARLKGAIRGKDKAEAYAQLEEAREHWEQLAN